jgi:predicted TIM-barrel fold metal-dependent hydrolase
MVIDVFSHILPKKFQERIEKSLPDRDPTLNLTRYAATIPTLVDLDERFRIMDRFEDYLQVLTIATPPIEAVKDPALAAELAAAGNDELAELVHRHPNRFIAGIAALPLNNMEAALREADRAIRDLRLRGVQMFTDVNDRPLDDPEFWPLYEKMAAYNLPILIHPKKASTIPDYPGEASSKYRVWTKLGWPYATALAMTRLVYSGVLEKYPTLKIVTHHCGGLIPFLAGRITWNDDFNEMTMGHRDIFLQRNALDYYRLFYYDTAVNGYAAALRCGLSFAGIDRMVFATDFPFGNQLGNRLIRDTIRSVEELGLGESDRRKIYENNPIRLLRLPLAEF